MVPICRECLGRGGFMTPYGWRKCQCSKAGPASPWLSYMNSIGAKNPAPKPSDPDPFIRHGNSGAPRSVWLRHYGGEEIVKEWEKKNADSDSDNTQQHRDTRAQYRLFDNS